MERQYVGIDLHRRRSVIYRMDQGGNPLGWVRIDNSPAALLAALSEAPQEGTEVVVEATYGWYWAVQLLQDAGYRVHLAHPAGNDWGHRRVKNDLRDARDLADLCRLGRLAEAWVAPPEVRELRELVRFRFKLVGLRTGLKAQVHAVMAKEGVIPEVKWLFGPTGNAQMDAMCLAEPYTLRVESLRDLIVAYDRDVATLERRIHRLLKDHTGYRAIQALDGVGRTTAAIFVAEIGDVTRFPRAEALCSWAGLAPTHHESDQKVVRGHITKMGSKMVRWAAIEAVTGRRADSYIRSEYQRLTKTVGKYKARTAAARKLLTLVYYGLRDGEIRCLRDREAG